MIHAYAIEPEVVVAWSELSGFRFVYDKFGTGTPRVLLELPLSKWEDMVSMAGAEADLTDLRWKRVDELLLMLRSGKVCRNGVTFQETTSWLENAEAEYSWNPFTAIISTENPRRHTAVIKEQDVGKQNDPRWTVPIAATPSREASQLAQAVAALLQNCSELHIVDPYFGPENRRHREVVLEFLKLAAPMPQAALRLTIHCSSNASLGFFESKAAEMARQIPNTVTISFFRWKKKEDGSGERFHNRYLLSDIGGVTFGGGLDAGDSTETEDINLMDQKQYEKRWGQFALRRTTLDLIDQPSSVQGRRGPGSNTSRPR